MRWIVTVIVIVIDILTIIYYAHDPYSKLRKTFKGNKSPPLEQYEKYKNIASLYSERLIQLKQLSKNLF